MILTGRRENIENARIPICHISDYFFYFDSLNIYPAVGVIHESEYSSENCSHSNSQVETKIGEPHGFLFSKLIILA
jgi:hypothetical protein